MPSKIDQPLKFRSGLMTKNRIVLAPLTNMQSPTTRLSDDEFNWLNARIKGGFGVVTTCASHVLKDAQAWEGELGCFDESHVEGYERLAKAANAEDTLLIPQLFHGGFRSPSQLNGVQPVSASVFELQAPDFEIPRALSENEIQEIKSKFVEAAVRVVNAGAAGVEVHGANGYLFTQFLSSFTNRRTDRWGGSLENRSRFLREVVEETRTQLGPNKVIGVRLSPENTKLIPNIDIDEMKDLAIELAELGIDYLSLSLWEARKLSDKYGAQAPSIVEQFPQRSEYEDCYNCLG